MKQVHYLMTTAILLLLTFSAGHQLWAGQSINDPMQFPYLQIEVIKGIVAVKGSEPHTFLCLTTEEGTEYKITGNLKYKLSNHWQQQVVSLQGKVVKPSLGPGIPAEFEVKQILTTK